MHVNNRLQHGFALFEVMVTVFLLAVGVLGLAAVQMKTYSITRDSDYRTNVALHAEGLAEAMRANPTRALDASNVMSWSWNHYSESTAVTASQTAPTPNCRTSECTQNQLAAYDLYEFHQNLRESFPADNEVFSQVCPTTDFSTLPRPGAMGCAVSGPMTIKVAWRSKATRQEAQAASAGAASGVIISGFQMRVDP